MIMLISDFTFRPTGTMVLAAMTCSFLKVIAIHGNNLSISVPRSILLLTISLFPSIHRVQTVVIFLPIEVALKPTTTVIIHVAMTSIVGILALSRQSVRKRW